MKRNPSVQSASAVMILILLAGIAVAQVPPAAADKSTTNKRGAITGRVLGEDGEPLEGATVLVLSLGRERTVSRTVTTDEDGNFKVNNLSATAYTVMATAPGMVSAQGNLSDLMAMNSAPRYRIGETVTITMVKGGAITGKVLDAAGQPLVGAPVFAIRVRDGEGRAVNETLVTTQFRMTDDRGIYRIYGLQAGSYVVYTNGAGELMFSMTGGREVPTYYPAATRDTAQEVSVAAGMEAQAIDIRHRGEPGHAISGTVVGASDANAQAALSVMVELLHVGTGTRAGMVSLNVRSGNGFAMYGVADGEYELIGNQRISVFQGLNDQSNLVSAPRRVTVRGGDVTGIELRLTALGSMAGRVVLDKLEKTDCQITRRGALDELVLVPRREDKDVRRGTLMYFSQDAMPDDKGEFVVRDLEAGRYRLTPQLPSDHWYIKAMNLATTAPARPTRTAAAVKAAAPSLAATGITLKGGEKLSGVTITLAEGAAGLNGRLEGKKSAARMRVFVVPAEKEAADDVLRYAEVVTRDGNFALHHLAPGKYWLYARAVPDDEADEKPAKPVAWDATERAKLRREAEAANNVLELTACQRVKEFVLKLSPTVK